MPKTEKTAKIKNRLNVLSSVVIAIAAVLAIVWLYFSGLSLLITVPAAIVVLLLSGYMIQSANGFIRLLPGMYMLGSSRGVWIIDWLAKRGAHFWIFMADWGLVTSFGLFSYFMFRKRMSTRMILLGSASAFLIATFVLSFAPLGFSFINIPQISSRIA